MGEVSLHSQCVILGELVIGTIDRIREELRTDGYLGPYVEVSLETGRRQVVEYLITMYYKQKVSGMFIVKEESVEPETSSLSTPQQADKRRHTSPSSSLSSPTYINSETVGKKRKLKVNDDNSGYNADEFSDDDIDDMTLDAGSDVNNISLGIHDNADDVPDMARSTTTPDKNRTATKATNKTTVSKRKVRTQRRKNTTPVVVVKDIFNPHRIWVDPVSLTRDEPVDSGAKEDETKPIEFTFRPRKAPLFVDRKEVKRFKNIKKCKEYRERKKKSDPNFKQAERLRSKMCRLKRTEEQRLLQNEQARVRNKRYREKLKKNGVRRTNSVTTKSMQKRRREYWRKKKAESRQKMAALKKRND